MIKFGQKLKNTDFSDYFITSDLHFYHKKIIEFCSETRPWSSLEEMHEALIEHWNSKVSPEDVVFHLGDFSFGNKEQTLDILSKLNGNIVHIYGNHAKVLRDQIKVTGYDYLEIKYDKTHIIMNHYPQYVWNRSHYGSCHLFGHCVDLETDILTSEGFKSRGDLLATDIIYSYDPDSGRLTLNSIDELIDINYTGWVVSLSTNRMNLRVTDQHTLVGINKSKGVYEELTALEWLKKKGHYLKFIRSAEYAENTGINYSDNELALYISLVADGNVVNTDLGRFRFSKSRKVEFITELLERMQLPYTKSITKDKMTNINFTIPKNILKLNIKGLDKILLKCNKNQAKIILDTYAVTDGHRYNNCVVIYTSKISEVKILEHMFVITGFKVNVSSRFAHGFSKNYSYELCVTDTQLTTADSSKAQLEYVIDEPFWCIKTKLQNFICKRKGKISVTGNCHGSFQGQGRMIDVGFDAHGKILTLDEAIALCNNKDIVILDHHDCPQCD